MQHIALQYVTRCVTPQHNTIPQNAIQYNTIRSIRDLQSCIHYTHVHTLHTYIAYIITHTYIHTYIHTYKHTYSSFYITLHGVTLHSQYITLRCTTLDTYRHTDIQTCIHTLITHVHDITVHYITLRYIRTNAHRHPNTETWKTLES